MSRFTEPRRQAYIPDTPPSTPPTSKEGGLNRSHRPMGILTELQAPPLTPDASPHPGYSPSPTLMSPADLPGDGSGTVGLGLGFSEQMLFTEKRSYRFADDEKGYERQKTKPLSQFSSPGAKSRGYIVNPYTGQHPHLASSYFLRVPRRLRPVLLLATSLLVFGLVLISRTASAAAQAGRLAQMIRQAETHTSSPFGRRYTSREGLAPVDISQAQGHVIGQGHDSRLSLKAIHRTLAYKSDSSAIKLTPEDELLALVGFITAATGNSLPATVSPSEPIEPSVLVGFDPAGPSAAEDLELLKDEINTQYPLVLFGRMRDPWHIALRHVLDQYKITPAPLVVDVDQRPDHDLLTGTLERLLGTDELPQLVLQGTRLPSAQELVPLTFEELKAVLTATHAVAMRPLTDKEKKGSGHGKNGKVKAERERLLAPAPIVVE